MVRGPESRKGFALVEVLVAVVLLLLVLFLLFRGFAAVTDAVTRGGRQSALDRETAQALRVIREDLSQMVVLDRVPLRIRTETNGSGYPLFEFLRMENQVSPLQDRAVVAYWVEPHPDDQALLRLVRYARPSDQAIFETSEATFRTAAFEGLRNPEAGEVIVDHLVGIRVRWRPGAEGAAEVEADTWGQTGDDTLYQPPRYVDVQLAVTREPVPLRPGTEGETVEETVLRLDGRATGVRIFPKLQPQPEWR